MSSRDALTLVLEGLPGAGKTALMARLVRTYGDDCVFFAEPLVRLTDPTGPVHPAPAAHTLWYLRHERQRLAALARYAEAGTAQLLVRDRNHLGALAYCFASRRNDALPYARARDYFLRHIAPHQPAGEQTVILSVTVPTSLGRRHRFAAHPRWQHWFDAAFLERLATFYADHAPALCPTPPTVIDTNALSRDGVAATVIAFLTDRGLHRAFPCTAPAEPRPIDLIFAAGYRAAGGLSMLGSAVTDSFTYRDGTLQIFKHGALWCRDGGVRLWDPITAAEPSAVLR